MKYGAIHDLNTFWAIFVFIGLPWSAITVYFRKDADWRAWAMVLFFWGLHAFVLYRYYIIQRGLGVLP